MDRSNYTIVAALDIGLTDSGYAFSLKSDFIIDPLKIHANECWKAKDCMFSRLLSLKTPTCVLLDEDKELIEFGYAAENAFADILLREEENNYYFFSGFYTKKVFPLLKISVHLV